MIKMFGLKYEGKFLNIVFENHQGNNMSDPSIPFWYLSNKEGIQIYLQHDENSLLEVINFAPDYEKHSSYFYPCIPKEIDKLKIEIVEFELKEII